ncbi:hypothetical protein ACJMK2_039086 [Sinanodonta woodiana]|uniref:Ras GTPase-activating protein nGAP n=2 Tax=Sinanodonta woodiana TaxID=1069815 RepID=A0ABD3WE94_SINWO
MFLHRSKKYSFVSSERLFKTKLLDPESLPDSSYEKLVGDHDHDHHGSVPVISADVDEEDSSMDANTSTPSRFTNFLIRKGFKSNLKRTKSALKLDRKRSAPPPHMVDNDSGSFVGSLKRTMSLGRLTRKRTRTKSSSASSNQQSSSHQHSLTLISSRLRNSQSHESLLTDTAAMHSVDLTATDIDVKPLHNSILGQDHCFQVSTSHGNKYISCRSSEEREKWIESLRKTVHPHQEHHRRTDNSLTVWVVEAKNLTPKKRYFCEIFLDKTLYAKTSVKTKGEMLFWGEQFEFNNLPSVEIITVNLYREADKKKKKDRNTLLGYIKILAADVSNRQFVERWYNTSSGTVGKGGKESKTDLPIVRLKARYQTTQILPMELYQDFIQYLSNNYCVLCEVLEPLLSIRDKEELARTMIRIMQNLDKAKEFLSEVVMTEVLHLDNQHLTFRGNSIATKSMEAYMKLVGEKYLHDTLGDFVKTVVESDDDCEVDPTKIVNANLLSTHQKNLQMYCEMAWTKIITSSSFFPSELKEVFTTFREKCNDGQKSDNLISGSIFLRFLCPAVLSPSLFNLTQEFPPDKASRNLTLIAKTIQNLANFTKFGGKEEFMTFMNDFVEQEWANMKDFLARISKVEKHGQLLEFDGYIDLGKEVSTMHTLLKETLSKDLGNNTGMREKLGKLPEILTQIDTDVQDPNVTYRKPNPNNRRSMHYDNLGNIQGHIQARGMDVSSPSEFLANNLQLCEKSTDQMPLLNSRESSRVGSFDVGSSRQAATDLNTNDDYVSSCAISSVSSHKEKIKNVSVRARTKINEKKVNESWNKMLSAADIINGEHVDLISFMDDEVANSSMEFENNVNGSQMSLSQGSTIASSGYQSFGYSQSNSPIENAHNHDSTRDYSRTFMSQSTPLSFANPMYRHKHGSDSSRGTASSPILQTPSTSSLSSSDEANTVKNCSIVKSDRIVTPSEALRKIAPKLSSSSSNESIHESEKSKSQWTVSMSNVDSSRKYPTDLRTSSPILNYAGKHSSSSSNLRSTSHSHYNCNTIGSTPLRTNELSHSVDFMFTSNHYGEQLRRTATDTVISQRSSSPKGYGESALFSSQGSFFSEDSSRKLSSQNAVHMGIRSVQRKLHEQEKTKHEYESEVEVLKHQLAEAQLRLQRAEAKLLEHESGTRELISDWQLRLEESEERMRKQQVEKDDQMKNIIQRLISVEDELRHEQEEMQHSIQQKQKVIEAQEKRIQSLDSANSKLVAALNKLKEHCQTTPTQNGLAGSLKAKLKTELPYFKTSSC